MQLQDNLTNILIILADMLKLIEIYFPSDSHFFLFDCQSSALKLDCNGRRRHFDRFSCKNFCKGLYEYG